MSDRRSDGGGGNRTYEISTVGSTTSTAVTGYAPDANRMVNVTTDGTLTRSFGHDAAGNLTSDTKAGTPTTTPGADLRRRHTSASGRRVRRAP